MYRRPDIQSYACTELQMYSVAHAQMSNVVAFDVLASALTIVVVVPLVRVPQGQVTGARRLTPARDGGLL